MLRGNIGLRGLTEKRSDLIFGFLVTAAALLVYANSLGNGFVTDDPSVILHNPVLQGSPLSLFSTIDSISNTQLLPFYRPLTYLTFYAEGRLHGFNPFLMHLVNVIMHAANAFLVYRLSRVIFDDQVPALIAGLLFAIHPIHSEGVDFLSGGRNTMLACFFSLMAYLVHHRGIVQRRVSYALLGALFFLAGLFSKESAMMVLPFIIVQELSVDLEKRSSSRLQSAVRLAPYAVAATWYLLLRWMTLSGLGIQTGLIPGFGTQKLQDLYVVPSLAERLINNLYIIPAYVYTAIWPVSLSSRYEIPADFHLFVLPLAVGWFFIIAVIAWLFMRGRSYASLFGLSWIAAFWLPVSGIIYFSNIQMADRFLYTPAIGLWIIAADQAVRFLPAVGSVRRYAIAVAVIICAVLATLTVKRNLDWKSDMTLYSRLVEQYPDNASGHAGLGTAYFEASKRDGQYLDFAEEEFQKALALAPNPAAFPKVHNQFGHIKQNRGDYAGALYHYNEALAIFPYDKEARINRGIVYEKLGKDKEALSEYQFFLSIGGGNDIPGSREYAEERVRELTRR